MSVLTERQIVDMALWARKEVEGIVCDHPLFRGDEAPARLLALKHDAVFRGLIMFSEQLSSPSMHLAQLSSAARSANEKMHRLLVQSSSCALDCFTPTQLRALNKNVEALQALVGDLSLALYTADCRSEFHLKQVKESAKQGLQEEYNALFKAGVLLDEFDLAQKYFLEEAEQYPDTFTEEAARLAKENERLAREVKDHKLALRNQKHAHARQKGHMAGKGGQR